MYMYTKDIGFAKDFLLGVAGFHLLLLDFYWVLPTVT